MLYQIEWKHSAQKELLQLPKKTVATLIERIEQLAKEPRPFGVRKLVGTDNLYRIREGNYRVVYSVWDEKLMIEIIHAGHRKDVYRK